MTTADTEMGFGRHRLIVAEHFDKVIRIQGDKLCELLGYEKGTKIDVEIIRSIANSGMMDMIVLDGRGIILLEKIENGPV